VFLRPHYGRSARHGESGISRPPAAAIDRGGNHGQPGARACGEIGVVEILEAEAPGVAGRPEASPPDSLFTRLPSIIVIDVTNSCNLACPVCPVTIAMSRKRGMMPMPVFRRIVDDFRDRPEKPEIFFNFSGEPTLNRRLPEFVACATQHGHKTFLSTNATRIDERLSRALIEAGLDRVYLCMDGFDAEAQEAYRVKSRFAVVKRNIETFVRLKHEHGSGRPLCILQTLLTRYSEGQVGAIEAWAREIGLDRIRFKTFSTGTYTTAEEKALAQRFLPENPAYRRIQDGDTPTVCHEPLHSTVVYFDGDLGLCCIDYDKKVRMPNIMRDGFIKAYLSAAAVAARRAGYLKQHPICRDCAYNAADNMGFTVKLDGGSARPR
jgi:MoaA/NifB/PqqE/SkfB family radical SAM enzyme